MDFVGYMVKCNYIWPSVELLSFIRIKIVTGLKLMKMGLADASNKDKMDKTIYQSDYFTGYGVKDWGALSSEVLVPNQIVHSWAK